MGPYRYVIKVKRPDGNLWTSPEVFEGDMHHVLVNVAAATMNLSRGEVIWAETHETEMFLFGYDSTGKPHSTGTAHPDFTP